MNKRPRLLMIGFFLVLTGCDQGSLPDTGASADYSGGVGMEFFQGSFEDALAKAQAEDKKVFVDVYTEWCGPCIVMQETVFPLPEVGEYFNARFVNFALDAEDETRSGPELAARFDVGVYPTYLVLDSEGSELGRATSGMSGKQFIAMVSQMLGETESDFAAIATRFDQGDRSSALVQRYLDEAIVRMGLGLEVNGKEFADVKKDAGDYFESREYSVLINETDARLIMTYWDKVARGDELVEFVIDHYDEFLAVSSQAAMSQFVLGATWYAGLNAANLGDGSYKLFLHDLEQEPLLTAVAYDLARDPESLLDPERMRRTFQMRDLVASEAWDAVADEWNRRIETKGDSVDQRTLVSAARDLGRSPKSAHHARALELAAKGYALNKSDLWAVIIYHEQLRRADRAEFAEQILEKYRTSLPNTPEYERQRRILDGMTSDSQD